FYTKKKLNIKVIAKEFGISYSILRGRLKGRKSRNDYIPYLIKLILYYLLPKFNILRYKLSGIITPLGYSVKIKLMTLSLVYYYTLNILPKN
ncbi:uncharacterized protein N7487_007334, partial [Penicillium crustosum]|uniref:uncharacterized protein n=1 Tax=Penicillium crustosum TaxID=36656 RepID=UPI0023903828